MMYISIFIGYQKQITKYASAKSENKWSQTHFSSSVLNQPLVRQYCDDNENHNI